MFACDQFRQIERDVGLQNGPRWTCCSCSLGSISTVARVYSDGPRRRLVNDIDFSPRLPW